MEQQQLYIRVRGKVQGPFSYERLQAMARRGQFGRMHEVSEDGTTWERASSHPDLFVATTSPPALANAPQPQRPQARRSIDEEDSSPYRLAPPGVPAVAQRDQIWYYGLAGVQHGPVEFSKLQMLVAVGQLGADDLVWTDGMPAWTPVRQVPGLVQGSSRPGVAAGPSTTELPPRTSGLAVWSLVFGILGLLPLFAFGSLMAVIFGHASLFAINRSRGALTGGGMAVAGLILGYGYLLFLLVLAVIAAIVIFAGAAAR
jgi:hypothetical protein